MICKVKIIIVTALGQEAFVLDAIKARARKFIIKASRNEEIVKVVMRTVATSKISETRIFT